MHDGRPEGWTAVVAQPWNRGVGSSWDDRFPTVHRSFDARFGAPQAKAVRTAPKRQRRGRPAQGKVSTYVIGLEDSPLVKIGYTSVRPHERRAALQTGLPFELTLLWSIPGDFETRLHDMFEKYRVRGEWFDLTPLGDPLQVVRSAVGQLQIHAATE